MNSPQDTQITQLKNETFGLVWAKLLEAIWLTVVNEIFKFPPHLGPFCQISYLFELSSVTRVTQFKSEFDFFKLAIYFNSKCFSRTENLAHAIRCVWPKFVKVVFLNFWYDHKDYANFDNAFSLIMKSLNQSDWKLIVYYRTVTNLKTLIGWVMSQIIKKMDRKS